MKKALTIFLAVALVVLFVGISDDYAKDQGLKKGLEKNWKSGCTTIQSGLIVYSVGHFLAGQSLMIGFDPWGYNYQGCMFSGSYTNSYLGGAGFPPWDGDNEAYLDANPTAVSHWAWPYRDVTLMMKWNDAWLSNTDCNSDGSLDRHNGFVSYIGSGAWLTNHQQGTYITYIPHLAEGTLRNITLRERVYHA